MNNLSKYIIEKLHLNKDIEQDNFRENLEEEVINYLTGKLHYEYKKDYTFTIKDPKIKDSNIIYKIHINLISEIILPNTQNELNRFCKFITDHLENIFKDKKFTFNCDLHIKEIEIYIRNK